jgi:hypothetical protein
MEREIALGLFERGEIRYIPLLLSPGVSFPKEVQDHKHNAVLFSDHPDKFEQLVDRLVFPGITGRHVECLAVSGPGPQDGAWTTLERAAAANDIDLSRYTDIERAELHVADLIARKQRPTRVVVFVDLLEGRTGTGSAPVYSPQQYAAMVQRLRTQYQEVNPVRFVFYQRSDAWRQPALGLDPATVAEFTKFFTLDRSGPAGPAFDRAFRARWNTVLKDLMKFEHE